MQNVVKDISSPVNDLTDQNVLLLINEFAKIDTYALKLMIQLQDAKEFGQQDMILSKMHRYLKDKQDVS